MLAQQFVEWCKTASVAERCQGVTILADAVTNERFLPAEMRQAEAALVMALDDPSPRVRRTLAVGVASSGRVPREVARRLAGDVDEVALPVIAASPLLDDNDLAALAAEGRASVRAAVGRRPGLARRVSAVLLEHEADAPLDLLRNETAEIDAADLRRLAERAVDDAPVRDALLRRDDLPSDARHSLLEGLASALCASAFVSGIVGAERVRSLQTELREKATAALVEILDAPELPSFVEHLRDRGSLNTALLVRAVCCGRIDFFAAALARLSGLPEARVRSVVADAGEPAFSALMAASGVSPQAIPLLLSAVRVWKGLARGPELSHDAMAAAVVERVSLEYRDEGEYRGLSRLLYRLGLEAQANLTRRRVARHLAA